LPNLISFSDRRKFVIITIILVLVILGSIFLLFFRSGNRDISWIDDVNDYIEELKPFPQPDSSGEPMPVPLSMYHFYLYENGSSQLIFHTSKKSNDFVAYMRGLLNKVNRIKNSSVSREFLDEVVGTNKVLMFFFRFDEDFWSVKKVERAFFILEDNLNRDLEGTIIIRRRITGEGEYSLREIANFFG